MSVEHLPEIIYEIFDPKAQRSAERWVGDIATRVDDACRLEDDEFVELKIDPNEWEAVYKPALLWRFYRHLGAQLSLMAEGHAQVLTNTLMEKEAKTDGVDDPH